MNEALKKAQRKYDVEKTRKFTIKLSRNVDGEIIEHLEKQGSIQGYIKEAIREKMARD